MGRKLESQATALHFLTPHVAHRLTAGKAVAVLGPGFLVTQPERIDGPVGVAVGGAEVNIFLGIGFHRIQA